MHELPFVESLLEIATKHAKDHSAKKVTSLNIVLGQLSSIVDDSIEFYWEILSKDTLCSDSKINFTRVQAKMTCLDCGNEYSIEKELKPCPVCNSINIKVLTGEEFYLDSIDVET